MYVLTFIGQDRRLRYGPTSENPSLLENYRCQWPSWAVTAAVLEARDTFLLRVRSKDVTRALREAGYPQPGR